MEIVILGSGTLLSSPVRNPAGYWLQSDSGVLLLDVGPGIVQRLKQGNLDPLAVQTVVISHFHLDHCADLFPLLMYRFLLEKLANKKLTIWGPRGTREWFATQAQWQGSWLQNALPGVLEWQQEVAQLNGWTIAAMENGHTENSLSLRIENEGRTLFYSSDTDYNEALIPLAKGANLSIIECSLPDHLKQTGHLTPSDVKRFVQKAALQRVALTHLYPPCERIDLLKAVDPGGRVQMVVARDFLKIEV